MREETLSTKPPSYEVSEIHMLVDTNIRKMLII